MATKTPQVWYVIANRAGALVYEESQKKKFQFVRRLVNQKGRRQERELVTDRPGRGRLNAAQGGHHTYDASTDAREHVAETFAARIARVVETAWNEKEFNSLVVAAEPHFLGLLKDQLARHAAEIPTQLIAKEYRDIADRDLGKRIHADLSLTTQ